jgi:aminoglycoside phosphotransferase (APT) family kinase protein
MVRGDAHGGNIAATDDGDAILLDLERFAIGPPEWDLMLAAFDYGSVGWLPEPDYRAFADRYGYEVTNSPRYPVLRDIRELRKTLFAAQLASENPALADQAAHRLACLRGRRDVRPWPGWHPVP